MSRACTFRLHPACGWRHAVGVAIAVAAHAGVLDYRILPVSPCIDVGVNAIAPAHDIRGTPRPLDGNADGNALVDMGAFEYAGFLSDTDLDGMSDGWEVERGLDPTSAVGAHGGAGDPDGDGVSNTLEFAADTYPHDASSRLVIMGVAEASNDVTVLWRGGVGVTQYLEVVSALDATGETWRVVYTGVPPTGVTNQHTVRNTTDGERFYRIRTVRWR